MHQWKDPVWDHADLKSRVVLALEMAERTALTVAHPGLTDVVGYEPARVKKRPLVLTKVVAESVMLMRCAAALGSEDKNISDIVARLAQAIRPQASNEAILVDMCGAPSRALETATAHILLTDLGYPDPTIERLLAEILNADDSERLPSTNLEAYWLHAIWNGSRDVGLETRLLTRSCLSRPLDALASTPHDIYAFTHAILHGSDMGLHTVQLPRSADAIVSDADAALAVAMDADNYDLAAELLWTWPMLGLTWSPTATFCFHVLAHIEDDLGFLPGPDANAIAQAQLTDDERRDYVLHTSYHTTYVMGFLCAAAARSGAMAQARLTKKASDGTADLLLPLLGGRKPAWWPHLLRLESSCRDSLSEFLLAILLRRASAARDYDLLRTGLSVGLDCDISNGPAMRQSVALLRRLTILGNIQQDRLKRLGPSATSCTPSCTRSSST